MTENRTTRWALTGARLLTGAAAAVAVVVAVTVGLVVGPPGHRAGVLSLSAVPTPSASVTACTGAILDVGGAVTDAAALPVVAAPKTTVGTSDGEGPTTIPMTGASDLAPDAYTAEPKDRRRVDVAAAASAAVESPTLRGFAASACQAPLPESWLVAGSGTTGSADVVLLTNPGAVAATVTLTVYGADGATTPAGGAELVIAPHSQRAIPLAGLVYGETAPIIRVTATGAPVSAALQSRITRTLLPGGIEQTGSIEATSTELVIPGVTVVAALTAATPASSLRVVSPASDTMASVQVTDADGREVGTARQVPLSAAVPVEVDLGALPVGQFTVSVRADSPVVGAVWQTTGFGEGTDFAWFSPAPGLAAPTVFAVAAGPSPTVTLANASTQPVNAKVLSADGSTRDVTVPAAGATAGTASFALPAGVYTLSAADTVAAAVSYRAAGQVASYPIWPGDAAAPAITVYP